MQAQHHVETCLRSLFAIHGLPAPGGDQIGQLVHAGMALLGPEARRSPDRINTSVIGQLDGLVLASVEAGRPRNLHGAEAARAAQAAGGGVGQRGGVGFGYIDAIRAGSSARYRELGGGDGKGGGSAATAADTGGMTAEFARSFAGTGMMGGILRTFADVGLDRSTFNAFRREGFSKAQIVDNARDSKVLGWKGKDDLSIAQHASTEARKAAVATEQAKTPEARAKGLAHEAELEKKNEARPDTDTQKHHNRRFFERRHQDHLRHDAKAGLGTEARQRDAALPPPEEKPTSAGRASQDGVMAREAKKQTISVRTTAVAAFADEPEKPTPPPAKPAPVRVAAAKPPTPAQG